MVDVLIVIQVVIVDIVDERDCGRQRKKALNILAGLGDEGAVPPDAHAAAQKVHIAAHMNGRIAPGGLVDAGKHGGDGCLAVAAGDGHHGGKTLRNLAQRNAALQLRDTQLRRQLPLRIVGFDGSAVDHKLRVPEIFARMSHRIGNTGLVQRGCKLGLFPVAAGDLMPLRLQYQRKAVHAAPADADEMDSFCVVDLCHGCSFILLHYGREEFQACACCLLTSYYTPVQKSAQVGREYAGIFRRHRLFLLAGAARFC